MDNLRVFSLARMTEITFGILNVLIRNESRRLHTLLLNRGVDDCDEDHRIKESS